MLGLEMRIFIFFFKSPRGKLTSPPKPQLCLLQGTNTDLCMTKGSVSRAASGKESLFCWILPKPVPHAAAQGLLCHSPGNAAQAVPSQELGKGLNKIMDEFLLPVPVKTNSPSYCQNRHREKQTL